MNETEIKPGAQFTHARFITGGGQPELCRVTRVDRKLSVVYYRVGVENGQRGSKFKCGMDCFTSTVLGAWTATDGAR